jgi:hypothetical protein
MQTADSSAVGLVEPATRCPPTLDPLPSATRYNLLR